MSEVIIKSFGSRVIKLVNCRRMMMLIDVETRRVFYFVTTVSLAMGN